MVSEKTVGRKIDFEGNCIAESAAYIFVIVLNFIFTHLIEIQIFLNKKKSCFFKMNLVSFLLGQLKFYKKVLSCLFKVI